GVGEQVEVDGDADLPRVQDQAVRGGTLDGDRLRDDQRAERAGIEAVDLAADHGLLQRAPERAAGSGSAAGIDIVADPGDPGALDLRRRRRRQAAQRAPGGKEAGEHGDLELHVGLSSAQAQLAPRPLTAGPWAWSGSRSD